MVDYHLKLELQELKRSNEKLSERIRELTDKITPNEELWDSEDICRNWKISPRTLATWRSKKTIGFIKVNGKIWYPRIEREKFLKANLKK